MAKFRVWVDSAETPVVTADRHGRYITLLWPGNEVRLTLKEASELAEKMVSAAQTLVEYERPLARGA